VRDVDMLGVLADWPKDMTKRQREFVADMCMCVAKGKPLSPAQHQYLQSIYDAVVAFRFGLEPMGTDREYAAKRAQSQSKKRWEKF
jgi:hypothetical protein